VGRHSVLGVVGGSGGVGASTFAAVLAAVLGEQAPNGSFLIDADPAGGGIDLLLGAEHQPGARWSAVRTRGGALDPAVLTAGLPRWGPVSFLAADIDPAPAAIQQVLVAAAGCGPVVVELPRWPTAAHATVANSCQLIVLVTGSSVRAISAARQVSSGIIDRPLGVVVVRRRNDTSSGRIADWLGVPLVGTVPASAPESDPTLRPSALPRAIRKVAEGVRDGLIERVQLDAAAGDD
jgi:secretion/DNA translocation related CpaE-like protein